MAANFKIPETSPGIPDKEYISKLGHDKLSAWIRARLRGNDPHYHLYENRGERREDVFIWIFKNIRDEHFTSLCQAVLLNLLIESRENRHWDSAEEEEKAYFVALVRLIARFYVICRGRLATRTSEQTRIAKILGTLCAHGGPLENNELSDGTDVYLAALFSLCEVENLPDENFWRQILSNNGKYATPAFRALLKHGPVKAAKYLPDFIEAHEQLPDFVTARAVEKEILSMYNSVGSADQRKALDAALAKAFGNCRRTTWELFAKFLERMNIERPQTPSFQFKLVACVGVNDIFAPRHR